MGGTYGTLLYVVVFFLIFYFMLIRPQQKKNKELKSMRDNISAGDEVVTIGGVVGQVVSVMDEDVVLRVRPSGTELTFKKWAVGSIVVQK
ncbi:preprotein translocase subunit YajC [Acidaminobacter sp.]|jgi:preprotein translocase subunit YajC|uniref:preprotein translocase subunit YajC n=1 Tax=Acidaminobacter sp. TaxID=1872102 RepID=UPI00137FAABA|nr:preprotein translocase subunit YajC [Acidaminobacter sp.]MDK9712108.1 preprotein translocase subunit YajC [Acidaminobacter sp.]MZQ98467.1 preprotein translocase subunit YajC [Acidaminobacter sp.]